MINPRLTIVSVVTQLRVTKNKLTQPSITDEEKQMCLDMVSEAITELLRLKDTLSEMEGRGRPGQEG